MTTCRYCEALDCDPEVHEAAANIHAYLRSLVNRNWAKDMAKAKAEAKKLWKVRHTEKPDYRTEVQRQRVAGGRRGGLAAAQQTIAHIPKEPRHRDRAAYMRQYRKTHPEAK